MASAACGEGQCAGSFHFHGVGSDYCSKTVLVKSIQLLSILTTHVNMFEQSGTYASKTTVLWT